MGVISLLKLRQWIYYITCILNMILDGERTFQSPLVLMHLSCNKIESKYPWITVLPVWLILKYSCRNWHRFKQPSWPKTLNYVFLPSTLKVNFNPRRPDSQFGLIFKTYHHARSRHWISVHKIKSPLCYDENCIQPTMQWLCSVSQTMCFGICTIDICKAKCSNMRLWSMAIIKFAMTTFMDRYEVIWPFYHAFNSYLSS